MATRFFKKSERACGPHGWQQSAAVLKQYFAEVKIYRKKITKAWHGLIFTCEPNQIMDSSRSTENLTLGCPVFL